MLLVNPLFPPTFWGYQHSLGFIGKRASLPPLGLVTLAASLPKSWRLKLVDLNLRPLEDTEILWADALLVGGMLLQQESMREVTGRARALGRRVAVGGPAASVAPDLFGSAHVVFCGEAEGRIRELVVAVEGCEPGPLLLTPAAGGYPELGGVPVPRFDLLELSAYASMSVQYSRGCPFGCEFCDVIELFGRVPRVKRPEQMIAELEALDALGWRGSVFVVDDNFVGNRRSVRALLPQIERWQEEHGRPFELYTEASLDLAGDPDLVRAMVAAGFSAVFVGIETPSREALAAANKRQNLRVDVPAAVGRLTAAGLEVMGGFIVGFDSDDREIFAAQRRLIGACGIPVAMVGVLSAMPGTALWRRLEEEGRLRGRPSGDQFERPNFEPVMDEEELLAGYARLLAEIYEPREYYRRCAAFIARAGRTPGVSGRALAGLRALLAGVLRIGLFGRRRWYFWGLLRRALLAGPHTVRRAVTCAIKGEHLIRYTEETVLPRLARAVADVRRGSPGPRAQAGDVSSPHIVPRTADSDKFHGISGTV